MVHVEMSSVNRVASRLSASRVPDCEASAAIVLYDLQDQWKSSDRSSDQATPVYLLKARSNKFSISRHFEV